MTDITIRGAGVFGLSIAWACVQRGASVQIIDPNGPAAGSSGGIVGALAPHVPENWNYKKAFQLESLLMAEAFWRGVREAGGVETGYARTGRLQPVADAAARTLALQRSGTARELWQGHAIWEVVTPPPSDWQPESQEGCFIHDTLSAHLHPRRACNALVAALGESGVSMQSEGKDKGAVVWATGVAGLEALSAEHTRSMGNGVKGQAALLRYDAAGAPQLFAGGVHIIPHLDGTVAIGSTSEREYDDPVSTDTQLEDVIAAARKAVPVLRDAPVVSRWAGVRPRARSRAPMLGSYPGRTDHYIANGGFKIGFGMAPKLAQVMADLVLDGNDQIPDGFRVEDNL
ncbi:NAD(P)/FAD-dependent oxidoreductase [Sulfitobacter guttiformis]|uniref:Glycine oxidase n=1 Tax=Sulfitobacter guttiformis TaxID=74349 RepID=A0A420DR13_9RHOB|nr:FAD-binding oxidoreductase [Sulfitobacter guttiformis]KIN74099.1 Oxidoreductase, FAD-binding [Sulfitobacter guttiformis KCTC 32187]RKE96716.1 glycine oxidase [Sulfitobacter guttiformis]